MEEKNLTLNEWHKKQAIENFNRTWDLMDKTDRTEKDDIDMIHTAHASRYHWTQVGTPLHLARGEWQISRVYAVLNMFESSLIHGKESLDLCLENEIKDFDLAFAYEAVARAYMITSDDDNMKKYLKLAHTACENIEKQEDKDYLLSELKTIK